MIDCTHWNPVMVIDNASSSQKWLATGTEQNYFYSLRPTTKLLVMQNIYCWYNFNSKNTAVQVIRFLLQFFMIPLTLPFSFTKSFNLTTTHSKFRKSKLSILFLRHLHQYSSGISQTTVIKPFKLPFIIWKKILNTKMRI